MRLIAARKQEVRTPTLHSPTHNGNTTNGHGGGPLSSKMKVAFIATHLTLFIAWTLSLLNPQWNANLVTRMQLQQSEDILTAFPFLREDEEYLAQGDPPPPPPPVKRYHEIHDVVNKMAKPFQYEYLTAYTQSGAGMHKQSCSVERVAIPLEQDEHNIINTLDAHDLADVTLQHYASSGHLEFFGNSLTPEMLPCLLPGTIISIDNHISAQEYFWSKLRPHIQVPFILVVTESDGNTPEHRWGSTIKDDPLLLKFYGTNPDYKVVNGVEGLRDKYVPMPLGLAKFHRQTPYLYNYLKLHNFTSPFHDLSRWTDRLDELKDPNNDNLNEVLFVKFNVHQYARHRAVLHDKLCKDKNGVEIQTKDGISCSSKRADPHETYNASSRYLFGISPPGAGWDCYRTYEMLLTGVIPLIDARPGSEELFQDLPVIHVPELVQNTTRTRAEFRAIMADYVESDAFRHNNFTQGWDRMFLQYWRQRMLRDAAGRDKEILTDPNTGKQYYQAYRYTSTKRPDRIYCGEVGKCEAKDENSKAGRK